MSDERQPRPFSDEQAYQQYVDANQSQQDLDQAVADGRVIETEAKEKTYGTMSMAELAQVIGQSEAKGDISSSTEAQHYLEEKIEQAVSGMSDELPTYEDLNGHEVVDTETPRDRYRNKLIDKYLNHAVSIKESTGDLYDSYTPESVKSPEGQELTEVLAEDVIDVQRELDQLKAQKKASDEEYSRRLAALEAAVKTKPVEEYGAGEITTPGETTDEPGALADKQPRRARLETGGEIEKLEKYESGKTDWATASKVENAEDATNPEEATEQETDTFSDLEGRLTSEQIALLQAHAREQKGAKRTEDIADWDKQFNELLAEVPATDTEKSEQAAPEALTDDERTKLEDKLQNRKERLEKAKTNGVFGVERGSQNEADIIEKLEAEIADIEAQLKPVEANSDPASNEEADKTQPESVEALNEAAKKVNAEAIDHELRVLRERIDELKAKEKELRDAGNVDEADGVLNEITELQSQLAALEAEQASAEKEPTESLSPNLDEVEPSAEPEDAIPHERAKRNWFMRKVDWARAKFWQKTTEGQASLTEAREEATVAAHGDRYDDYKQSIIGKNTRTDRFKNESEAELKAEYGEDAEITEDQIDGLVRKKERAFQKSIENTGWSHIKNLAREVRRPINREGLSDEEYQNAKSHKRKVIVGAVAIGAPIIIAGTLVGARAAGAFDHLFAGSGAHALENVSSDGISNPSDHMTEDQFREFKGLDAQHHETAYPPLTELDPQPGEYTADNIDINYSDYLSTDKVSDYAMGTHLDMVSSDTAVDGLFERAEGGPDQAAQMSNLLTNSQIEHFGFTGLSPQQIEERLHDDALRADVLNTINTDYENGSATTTVLTTDDLRQLEGKVGEFYNWGAKPIDANGNEISIEQARAQGITDTELVQYKISLQELIDKGASLLKVTNADGETVYFNSLCQNMLTEIPHHDVPIVEEPGTGSEGTGTEGTGSEGTGAEGTGSESTGSEGTGTEGTGTEGTGDEGTGTEGTGEETGTEGTGDEGTGEEGTGSEGTGDEGGDEKHYDGGVDTAPGIDPSHNTYDPGTDDTPDPATSGNGTGSPSIGEGGAPIQQPGESTDIHAPGATNNESPQVATPEQGANGDTGINQTDQGALHDQAQEQAQNEQDQANTDADHMDEQMSQPGAVDQAVEEAQAGIDPVTGRPIGQH